MNARIMKTSRRDFLKKSAIAVASTTILSRSLLGKSKPKEITGVQLYCVREEMKEDPLGSLTQLAKMGYKHVEHANYVDRKFYGYPANEFKKVLNDLGLDMPSGHTVLGKQHWDAANKEFTDSWLYTIEDAATMGQQFVVSPWLDESLRKDYDSFMNFLEVMNKSGELCQKSGMKFGYHNHDFEFSEKLNGEVMFDLIMKNTDPDKVTLQLDMGNMYIAGAKAMDVLNKYPGRFETVHVKDMIKSTEPGGEGFESTILGEGVIGTREVTDLSRKKGGTYLFIIEQESYQQKTPMECMKEDLAIMNKWGYKA
jgi:sugar phosphate isomerase/epimerase